MGVLTGWGWSFIDSNRNN